MKTASKLKAAHANYGNPIAQTSSKLLDTMQLNSLSFFPKEEEGYKEERGDECDPLPNIDRFWRFGQ